MPEKLKGGPAAPEAPTPQRAGSPRGLGARGRVGLLLRDPSGGDPADEDHAGADVLGLGTVLQLHVRLDALHDDPTDDRVHGGDPTRPAAGPGGRRDCPPATPSGTAATTAR